MLWYQFSRGKGKQCIMVYRGQKVLERRMRHMVKVGKMQFGFMPRQRLNRCSAHFKEVTRVLRQGEEVVYVLC